MALNDGLGYEELNQAGSQVASLFLTGSVTSDSQLSGLNLFAAGSMATGQLNVSKSLLFSVGSPYSQGVKIQLTARQIISGGMWVTASGNLAIAGPASAAVPLGIALATVASGGTVDILTHGLYPVIAEGTIAVSAPAMVGAGTALNTVVAATAASGLRTFALLASAGSENTVFVLL